MGVLISKALVMLLLLNSCAMFSREKFGMVRGRPLPVVVPAPSSSAGKTIVLMRVLMSLDDKPLESPADRLEFGVGSIYSPNVIPVVPQVLAEESKKDGWVYFILHPGTYNLWVLPPSSDPQRFRYTMEVRSETVVQYAGSLDISCRTAEADACAGEILTTDEGAARRLALESFPATVGLTHGRQKIEALGVGPIQVYQPPSNQLPRELFPMAILAGSKIPPTVIPPAAPYT